MGITDERLRKAETAFRKLFESELNWQKAKAADRPAAHRPLQIDFDAEVKNDTCRTIESGLRRMGLGVEQIQHKGIDAVKNAIVMLNACIRKPEAYLGVTPAKEPGNIICEERTASILMARKKFLLERYCVLTSREKIGKIRKILETVDNESARQAIEKHLIQLVIRDQFILEEFTALGNFYIHKSATPTA